MRHSPRCISCAIAVAIAAFAARDVSAREWVVEAHWPDRATLGAVASHFEHVKVDRKRQTLRVLTDDAGIAIIHDAGLAVTIDQAASARFASDETNSQGGLFGISGHQCYRTLAETDQSLQALATAHPEIVAIDDLGPSWEQTQNASQGHRVKALRITRLDTAASDPTRPVFAVFGSIHARELAPAELLLRYGEWLISNYGHDAEATWLVDHNDFRFVIPANPDGRLKAEQLIYWRKNTDSIAGSCASPNSVGVDLNRNFPFHWNITGGAGSSGTKCDETYRGPTSGSEPETVDLVNYVAGTCTDGSCVGGLFADRRAGPMHPPSVGADGGAIAPADTSGMFLDIHSNAALVLWPWGDTTSAAPNVAPLRAFGRRTAYLNHYTPEQSDSLYPTDGTTDDSFYGLLGVPAFTIEVDGDDFFEDCASFDGRTAPDNIATLRYASRALHAPYRLPNGPDALAITATPDLVVIGDPITVRARIDDTRFSTDTSGEPTIEPTQAIASANAYVDTLPWDAGALPAALGASDGTFNAAAEDVVGTISTAGLADGRHLVYVQGTDASGAAGTPNAAFIDVAAANEVGTVSGTVSNIVTHAPLAATIEFVPNDPNASHYQSTSAAVDGHYTRLLRAGNFTATARADGYLDEPLPAISLAAGQTLTRDVALTPACNVINDDVESGNQGWTASAPWAIVNGVSPDLTHVWATPNYPDNANTSLTSAAHDLTGYADLVLSFDDLCETEPSYDYGNVEVSADGGAHWTNVYNCTGVAAWQSHRIAVPASMDGAAAFKLRFRLTSDVNTQGAGWSVDNIRVVAGGAACRALASDVIFRHGFE